MTKAALPEPVAVICHDYDLFFMGGGPIADLARRLGVKVGDRLITTDQAEAYANVRVRETLEEAESIVRNNADACFALAVKVVLHSNADAIRALIPPIPGPVEP